MISVTQKLCGARPAWQRRRATHVVVSIENCSIIAKQAIEFASRLSPEIIAIQIEPGEHRQLSLLSFQAGLSSGFNEVSGYNLQPAPAVVEKAKGRCLNAPK